MENDPQGSDTKMKRLLLLPLAVAALALAPPAGAETKTVQITRTGFVPTTTTINVGDTVTFHNADTANHQVVADDGSFASPVLSPDQTYSTTFSKAGRVRYHDGVQRNRSGSVVVNGPPASVSLTTAAQSVTYGGGTMLSGAVSSKQASQSVVLNAQPYTEKAAKQANVTTTSTDGAFSFSVSPTIQTVYQAQWGKATSPNVTVFVRPRVGFGRSGRIYTAKVTSDIAYGGHAVYVQRRTSLGWRSVKKVFLSSSSRARFTMRLPRGRSFLRVWLPASQAGAGYITSTSQILTVRR
jgi:plastocyanin